MGTQLGDKMFLPGRESPGDSWACRVTHSLSVLPTYLLQWRVLVGQVPTFSGAGRPQSPLSEPPPNGFPSSPLRQSSTSGIISGLQLNASVCTQYLPAEVVVTGLAKIPGLHVLAAFSSCLHHMELLRYSCMMQTH